MTTPDPPPLARVAVVVDDGVSPFEVAVACEVFGMDRTEDGVPHVEFSVCSPRPGPIQVLSGFTMQAPHRLDPLRRADLIIVPAMGVDYRPPSELVDELRAALDRGARIATLCSGAFLLAHAGLLDGRRVTTHWRYAKKLAEDFPEVDVVPDVLFVEDGPIATSAGTSAGIDLCLHLVREAHGPAVANKIARRMVVPPHRDGGQAQFIEAPVADRECESLEPVLDWARQNLAVDLSVEHLAEKALMSSRTFARRFRAETGTTPHRWVTQQRLSLAEQLLEAGTLSVEEVATSCGFSSSTVLRHHFRRVRGTPPSSFRRAFAGAGAGSRG